MTKIVLREEHHRLLEAPNTATATATPATSPRISIDTTNHTPSTKPSTGRRRRRSCTLRVGVGLLLLLITVIVAVFSSSTSSSSFQITMQTTNTNTPIRNKNAATPVSSATTSVSSSSLAATASTSLVSALSVPSNGLRGKTAATTARWNDNDNNNSATKQPDTIQLSLWLIPPGATNTTTSSTATTPTVYDTTQTIIDTLAHKYHGPHFVPHVTIVGGIEVATDHDAIRLGEQLRDGLRRSRSNVGDGIQCRFHRQNFRQEPDCWNQALILEMDLTASFLQLCRVARTIIQNATTTPQSKQHPETPNQEEDDDEVTFPPPARVPHLSLYYGRLPRAPPSSLAAVDLSALFVDSATTVAYTAQRVMLWKTTPSTVEGVPEWTPITEIHLG